MPSFPYPQQREPGAAPPAEEASGDPAGFWLGLDLVAGRLTTRGRLSRDTAHLVQDAIAAMLALERVHWTLDVTDLVVRDRFGLRILTAAYRRLLRQGRRMTLEGASPDLRHALTRLRLDHHLLAQTTGPSEGRATGDESSSDG